MQNTTNRDDKECQYTCLYNIITYNEVTVMYSLVSLGMSCLGSIYHY